MIADQNNSLVRKVSAGGVITRVAGTVGTTGSAGDDGPATDAQLDGPTGVAVTADGGFLVADFFNNKVRKVSAGGVITRVAGTGTAGSFGDDGPATDAQLNGPAGVAVTADGGFLVADFDNSLVRKVSAGGVITRVAGTGTAGSFGDDGPATDAQLHNSSAVSATADGGFLIADTFNQVVRKVSAGGVVSRSGDALHHWCDVQRGKQVDSAVPGVVAQRPRHCCHLARRPAQFAPAEPAPAPCCGA